MLVRLTHIKVDEQIGHYVEIRLLRGEAGYILVRDAENPDDAPLATQVVGPHYTTILELRPRLLRDVRHVFIFGSEAAQFEIKARPMGRYWHFTRMLPRFSKKLGDQISAFTTRRLPEYAGWHRRYHSGNAAQTAVLAGAFATAALTGRVRVWLVGGDAEEQMRTRKSLAASVVRLKNIAEIVDFASPALQVSLVDDLHVFITAGVMVTPCAIALLALRLVRQGGPCVVYADAEAPGQQGLIEPLLTACFDNIRAIFHPGAQIHGIAGVTGADIVRAVAGQAGLEALACAACEQKMPVIHLPAILTQLPAWPVLPVERRSERARTGNGLVSFIIPSRDNGEMLERTIATLHVLRGNVPVEFIVVDHASTKPETADCLARMQERYPARVVRAEGEFNFSRLMNLGRKLASGEYIFSINDDIEARDNVWLAPLLDLLDRPDVGVVGACLLYPDWSLQHAGMVSGMNGHALHVGRGTRWHDPQLPAMLRQTRTVSAVTGAVLGARAETWDRAGGWNESLAVEFNDVDFCFRVGRLGLRTVCCAASVLIHHESVSRGDGAAVPRWSPILKDREAFIEADYDMLSTDPWYSPNLSLRTTRVELAKPPRRWPLALLAIDARTAEAADKAAIQSPDVARTGIPLRWLRRRWSFKHLWYRGRLPFRWRRWQQDCEAAAKAFVKDAGAKWTPGPAVVLGDFSGNYGLSRAAAYDVSLVRRRHASITLINVHDALAGRPMEAVELPGNIENVYFFCQPDTFKDVLAVILPEQIARCYRIGRFVWETPLFPTAWNFVGDVVHEIWTPSEFCAQTFREALPLPVSVIPHAVPEPLDSDIDMRKKLGVSGSAFLGLAIMDIKSCPERKNPWDHIRAWQAAFGNDPAAVLVLKLRTSKRTQIVRDELQEMIGAAQNIHLVWQDMSSAEISALQQAADVFLSLHRSEGYGLNIHEALRAGKRVLATNWSANAEYGPAYENYTGIDFTLVPYKDWTRHYADSGFSWAQASVADAARHLQAERVKAEASRPTAQNPAD